MEKTKLEEEKKELKRIIYGEADLGYVTKYVTDYFCIPFDEDRLSDYVLEMFDKDKPGILIRDKSTNTIYEAQYTNNAHLFNATGNNIDFIEVIATNDQTRTESLYSAEDKKLLATEVSFSDKTNKLVIREENANGLGQGDILKSIYVKYFDTSISKDPILIDSCIRYNKGEMNSTNYAIMPTDLYAYNEESITSGVDTFGNRRSTITGACFEQMNPNYESYMPISMHVSEYNELNNPNVESAIVYEGYTTTEDGQDTKFNYHRFEAYKYSFITTIKYGIKDNKFNFLGERNITLCNLEPGKFTIDELTSIWEELDQKLSTSPVGDDSFVPLIKDELDRFAHRISTRDNKLRNMEDILSPQLLIDMPLKTITSDILSNKDTYFNLVNRKISDSSTKLKKTTNKKSKQKTLTTPTSNTN